MTMRTALLTAFCMLVPFFGLFGQEESTKIRFEVNGLPDGHCRIIGMIGDQNYLLDSVLAQGGVATFERETPISGGLYYFVFPDRRTFIQFLADKDQQFTLKTSYPDLIGSMEVEGSLDNSLFFGNQQFEADFRTRYDSCDRALKTLPPNSLNKAFLENKRKGLLDSRVAHVNSYQEKHPESFFTVFKISGQNPELTYPKKSNGTLDTLLQLVHYRNHYWDNTDLLDERLLRTPVVFNKLKNYITKLTPQVPDSVVKYADRVVRQTIGNEEAFKFVVNWLAIKYEKPTMMGGDKILVHLVDNFFTDKLAFWYEDQPEELKKIRKKVADMRPSLVGKTAQNITCTTLDGGKESLFDLKTPIKVLWIYSYTCSHCKERTPVLVDLLKEWKAKGVDVYALCMDPEIDKWKEFVTKYNMESLHNVIDPDYESRYYKKYHIDITPEAYVIDENNVIVAKDLHPNQLPPIFEKALKK